MPTNQPRDDDDTRPTIGDKSAAERNKTPIFTALAPWLSPPCRVLEIGAGDAVHARHAARLLPDVIWQTSETPAHHRRLVAALVDAADPARLPAPLVLDVRGAWPADRFDAVYGANVAHIMGWDAVCALFAGAGRHLRAGGVLCLYGPFFDAHEPPAPGNLAFDRALRARNDAMGVRQIDRLDERARAAGLEPAADIAMPANNRLLVWRRAASTAPDRWS